MSSERVTVHMAPKYLPRAGAMGRQHGVAVEQSGHVTRPGEGRGLLIVSAEVTITGDEEAVGAYLADLPTAWEPDADHVESVLLLETTVTAARVLGWRDRYLATTAILQSLLDPTEYSEALLAPTEADVIDAAWIRHQAAFSPHAAMRHAAHHPSIDVEEDMHEIVLEVARLARNSRAPSQRLAAR